MRSVVYARYSSENQREASIADQVEVCRRFIERQGWQLGQVYSDAAMSGASRFRPDYQKLLADAERRQFDVVVCEALDRLGRKLADIADLFDRLTFHGVKLYTIATGEVTAVHIGASLTIDGGYVL
jgi:DNA invertase Pin-like site-specific DNA recombinase